MKEPSVEKLSSVGASQAALMWKCYHCTNLLSSKDQNWPLCIIFKRLDIFFVIMAGHLSNSNFFYKVGLSIKSPFFPGGGKRPALSPAAGVAQEPKTDARKSFRLEKRSQVGKGVLCPKFDWSLKGEYSEDCWLSDSRRHQKVLNFSRKKVISVYRSKAAERKISNQTEHREQQPCFCVHSTEKRLT